jgi:hypothetical protein
MEANLLELQSATDFVRQLFADQEVNLDYSPESIQLLDTLFEREFINGIFINGASVFAQYQGLIMTGITGYIAQVILQHTDNARLCFEDDDENWFINFAIESESGKKLMPGHRVLKRAYNGNDDLLYSYVTDAINYFNEPLPSYNLKASVVQLIDHKDANGKHWWKLW